jgi:hypothetical protein
VGLRSSTGRLHFRKCLVLLPRGPAGEALCLLFPERLRPGAIVGEEEHCDTDGLYSVGRGGNSSAFIGDGGNGKRHCMTSRQESSDRSCHHDRRADHHPRFCRDHLDIRQLHCVLGLLDGLCSGAPQRPADGVSPGYGSRPTETATPLRCLGNVGCCLSFELSMAIFKRRT